jgi:hypothetical protein
LSHWKIQEQVVAAGNCNTSFLLLSHPVHCCSTIVYFTNVTYQYKKPLSCCCFTSINVSSNSIFLVYFKSLAISYELKSKVREALLASAIL